MKGRLVTPVAFTARRDRLSILTSRSACHSVDGIPFRRRRRRQTNSVYTVGVVVRIPLTAPRIPSTGKGGGRRIRVGMLCVYAAPRV